MEWTDGGCVMRATFQTGRFNLNMTVPQALVILKFNDGTGKSLNVNKLAQDLQMNRDLLEETLKSLSSPLYPVLQMVEPTVYKVNDAFDFKGTGMVPLYALQSPFY